MKAKNAETGRYRLLKATAIVIALLVAAPGADAVVRFVAGSQRAAALTGGELVLDSGTLVDVSDAFGTLERLESVAESSQANADVPAVFSREVGFPSGVRDVRVNSAGDVVGYVVAGACEDVITREAERMKSLGWTPVALNGVQGSTFVKASGDCRWALVTYVQAGGETSVVVRSAMS